MFSYLCIALTILLTVYGQLIIKWQVSRAGSLPVPFGGKIAFLVALLWNPWIISGFAAAFLASLCWMAAISKLELSRAYPFVGATFVFVLIGSGLFFGESMTLCKIVGTMLILFGIIIASQG